MGKDKVIQQHNFGNTMNVGQCFQMWDIHPIEGGNLNIWFGEGWALSIYLN